MSSSAAGGAWSPHAGAHARQNLATPDLRPGPLLPPIHFSPEGSPLQRTYQALLREAARRDALDERRAQQKSRSGGGGGKPAGATSPPSQQQQQQILSHSQSTGALPWEGSSGKHPGVDFVLDGAHVQTERFTNDLLERVGLGPEDESHNLRDLSTASTPSLSNNNSRRRRRQRPRGTADTAEYYSSDGASRGGMGSMGEINEGGFEDPMSAGSMIMPHGSGGRRQPRGGGSPSVELSETALKRNHSLVEVLNDVQQVTLCFQEIIKHISFHRVNTGRVLWKLQATYVQLFERLVKVFSAREKKEAAKVQEEGSSQNQELDLLRLQVLDAQAKLDAAEKTKYTFKDTIKEQNAHIMVLQKEVGTLRAAIVEEAAAAEAATQRREAEEQEIRHKVALDVKGRADARRALFGGNEPSELDTAFTNSLGTMFEAIEDADERVLEQEGLLNDMNSLMDVQQVYVDPAQLAHAAFRKLRSRQNRRRLLQNGGDSALTDGKSSRPTLANWDDEPLFFGDDCGKPKPRSLLKRRLSAVEKINVALRQVIAGDRALEDVPKMPTFSRHSSRSSSPSSRHSSKKVSPPSSPKHKSTKGKRLSKKKGKRKAASGSIARGSYFGTYEGKGKHKSPGRLSRIGSDEDDDDDDNDDHSSSCCPSDNDDDADPSVFYQLTPGMQMIQEKERKDAAARELELKQKFEQERAELAKERAAMVKQLNKMREEVETQKAVLEQKEAEIEVKQQEHEAQKKSLERKAAKQKSVKLSNAQQLMNSVAQMGAAGPKSDGMTQTQVDEDCLWSVEGSPAVAISGPVLDQIWAERRAAAAALYGEEVVTRKFDPLAGPGDEEALPNPMLDKERAASKAAVAAAHHALPKPRGKGGWAIPPSLRHFMSNLPKTVESQPVKTLPWLSKTIDEIYHAKLTADYYDTRDGDPLQSLPDFLCEYLLMKYGLRRVAEMHLYEVVMSVKKYFHRNPKVLMFARFLGLVKVKLKAKSVDKHPDVPELDIGVLQVFLYTRRRLMLPVSVLHKQALQTPAAVQAPNMKAGNDEEDVAEDDEDMTPDRRAELAEKKACADHVVHTKDCRTYVPLGHAITQMRRVTSFMAPRKLIKFMRTIERGVAMRRGDQHDRVHAVSNDTGGQTAVRFVMRSSMLDNAAPAAENGDEGGKNEVGEGGKEGGGGDGGSGGLGEKEESAEWHVVCCLDTSLEVLLEILAVRTKQCSDELVRAFVEGDDNGDGVLSFDEFEAIIQHKRPRFSSRRALRMFKIALEKGTGNSTAIERPAFVETCKQFGMGQLVDTAELDRKEHALASRAGAGRGSLTTAGSVRSRGSR